MTREQAIKHLEVIKGDCALVGDIRALDMGISALKDEWIPIDLSKPKHEQGELPKHKQEVFVTYETEDGRKADKTIYHDRHGFAISPNVIAWKPCEPYKVEKGGE